MPTNSTLGPDVVQATFAGYCWIYYIAPYFAAIVSAGFYLALKWLHYEVRTRGEGMFCRGDATSLPS